MEIADGRSGAPSGALRGHVAYHGYDLRGGAPGVHRGLPSPYLTMIVTFGRPLTMRAPDGGLVDRAVALGGLHTTPEAIVHEGHQSGVHVVLDPLAARLLLGRPASELAGVPVDGDDVLGAVAREVQERVEDATGWDGRFAALDDVLGRLVAGASPGRAAGHPVAPEVRRVPAGGGVMMGQQRPGTDERATASGTFTAYVVVPDAGDVDALAARVRDADGAEVVEGPHDTDYGSHDVAVRDPGGNRWQFGTYPGAPRP